MEQIQNSNQNQGSLDSTLESISAKNDTVRHKNKRLFQRGCRWIGGGVFLLGSSFIINFILFHSNGAFIPYMYVLTSLGAICVMTGLVDIFG